MYVVGTHNHHFSIEKSTLSGAMQTAYKDSD